MKRRSFLATPAATLLASQLPAGKTRHWIGPNFFANRYQDWRLNDGRIECLTGAAGDECRAVSVLDRSIRGTGKGQIRVKLARIDGSKGDGFAGFLIGAGGGKLDWRAAALMGRGSGEGGGILCVYETTGRVVFRDHSSEAKPFVYDELPGQQMKPAGVEAEGPIELVLTISPGYRLTLDAMLNGVRFATSTIDKVPAGLVEGGLALISSPMPGKAGARFWFRDLVTEGPGISVHSDRSFGPILGTMYSVNGKTLKLTAQMACVGESDPQVATLDLRQPGGAWRKRAEAKLEPGYLASFRTEGLDTSRDWEYRVQYGDASYQGRIPKEPGTDRPLRVGFVSCVMPVWRTLDSGAFKPAIPGESALPRYTTSNFYFPHKPLITHLEAQKPDLLAFLGDQIYEGNPTRKITDPEPTLDYLYKWSCFVWAYRELTRNTPSVMMVDDHDVYHGNIWGHGGRKAPGDVQEAGGYIRTAAFVNIVQRTQCSHNPDPFDPTPVEQGIGVYYGAFKYGGVAFALVEDRKFKTGPQSPDKVEPQLLGPRQERFLEQWAKQVRNTPARICFTQTAFCCVQTSPEGGTRQDSDSNGTPKGKRDLALRLIRAAGALMVSGDQHLASVVRHGIEDRADGPVQFAGPGGGTSFQRWFEPAKQLENARGPNTGDYTDGFGNRFRVMAIANPKVTFADYRKHKPTGQGLGDRNLKSEGYGIVVVDHQAKQYTLECWPFDSDPRQAGAKQFAGWPLRIGFDGKDA
jgi:alkaline phosphatase D